MIDAEAYLGELWPASFAAHPFTTDVWVAPDVDVDTLGELPALTWNVSGDGEPMNGPDAEGLLLNLNIFGDGMDQAKAVARHVAGIVNVWAEDPWGTALVIDDVRIAIADVELRDRLSRLPAAEINGRLVVQYSGTYRLLLRSS